MPSRAFKVQFFYFNQPDPLKLSILIPCYNEELTLREIVQLVQTALKEEDHEIILIDDASSDRTHEIIEELAKKEESITAVFHDKNWGKGAAIRSGISRATGDVVIFQDADLEYDPNEYEKLLKPIISGKADVVYGSRFRTGEAARVLYFWHRMGNAVLTGFSNFFTNLNLTDMETCYKAFRREVLEQFVIEEKRFGIEPEITAKIAKIRPRLRIYEVGISYYGRTYEEGKKITWKDGIRAIYAIFKYNLFR